MLDWRTYHKQVLTGVGDISGISPDVVEGYQMLGAAGAETGLLGAKVRELIALAVVVNAGAAMVYSTGALDAHATISSEGR